MRSDGTGFTKVRHHECIARIDIGDNGGERQCDKKHCLVTALLTGGVEGRSGRPHVENYFVVIVTGVMHC